MARPKQRSAGNGFRVSLKQIAEATGCSMMTVSRALRGQSEIAAETREEILKIAGKLGYRPNLLVRGLQTGRSGNIALLVSPEGDFGSGIVRGAHDELVRQQYLPILHWQWAGADETTESAELGVIHRVLDRRVEGIILFPQDDAVPDLYFREVWKRGVPLLTVDRRLPRTKADFVGTDDLAGARLAAQHLLALGHCHVAHLAGHAKYGTHADRRAGFEAAIAKGKGRCRTVEVPGADAVGPLTEALLLSDPRPTAIFLTADFQAPAVYQTAAKLGLRIPYDLSVVGFADLSFAKYLTPPLTTVRQDPYGIGREAARIIVERCSRTLKGKEPVQLRLMPELIVRGSTAEVQGERGVHRRGR